MPLELSLVCSACSSGASLESFFPCTEHKEPYFLDSTVYIFYIEDESPGFVLDWLPGMKRIGNLFLSFQAIKILG